MVASARVTIDWHPFDPSLARPQLLVVTNRFENKTPEAMAEISRNIRAVEPTIEAIAEGLAGAAARVNDAAARIAGADVGWSRSWERSFPDQLIDRIIDALGLGG